jgi:mono/diheme cytochrome c family protein
MLTGKTAMFGMVAVVALIVGSGSAWAQSRKDAPAEKPASDTIAITKRVYDTQAMLNAPVLSDSAYKGRTVWLQRCAYCHDGVGQPSYKTMGPWLDGQTIARFTEEGFRAFVAVGTDRMPGWQYSLRPQQVNDVIAFLKTVTPDQAPTAAQLAGGKAGAAAASGD